MAQYDGVIRLSANLDTKPAEASLKSLKSTISSSLSSTVISSADNSMQNVNRTIRETQKEFEKLQNDITKTENAFRELQTKQSVILERGVSMPNKTAVREYDNKFFTEKDYASIKLLDTQLDNTGARLDSLNAKAEQLSGAMAAISPSPTIAPEMEQAAEQTDSTSTALSRVNRQLQELHTTSAQSTSAITSGITDVSNSINKLGRRITGLVKRVFIFSVITAALRSLRSMLSSVAKSNTEFSNSLQQIKANLWTAFAAIYTKVVPALNTLMSALAKVTAYIAAFFAALTGNTIEGAYNKANEMYQKTNEQALNKQQKNQTDAEIKAIQDKIKALQKENKQIEKNDKEQEKANKKALLSFDELNQLSMPQTENEQIAANEELIEQYEEQLEKLLEEKAAIEQAADAAGKLAENLTYPSVADTISEGIIEIIQNLVLVIEGSMLVIGVILLFTGNIALGLGVIIVSLLAMNYTLQDFEFSDAGIADIVSELWAVLIAAELVIGAILVFSGANIPLGIGIIVAAMIQGYALYEVAWDTVSQNVKNVITELAVASAVVMVALGIVMILSGAAIAAGIVLVIAGLAIGIEGIVINWEEVSTNVNTQIELIQAIVGGAMIAIGAILIFTGVGIVAGIALIIAGLAVEADLVVDWDEVPDNVKKSIETISEIVGGAMIIVGMILILTGVGIVAGIALIIAGFAIVNVAVDWNEVPDNVKNALSILEALISTAMIVIGAILVLTGIGIAAGAALIMLGLAIATAEIVNWDEVPDKVKESIASLLVVIGTGMLAIGVTLLLMGQIPIGLALTVAGVASLAMAIQAEPEKLRQKIQEEISFYLKLIGGALLVIGAILCFTGVAIPMGLALLAAGGVSLIGGMAISNIDSNAMSNTMRSALDNTNKTVTKGLGQMSKSFDDQTDNITDDIDSVSKRLSSLDGSEATIYINEQYNRASSGSSSGNFSALPHLAAGAVIPPNREFMAVLGDQKKGTNVEAPLATIKQAVAEVLGEGGIGGSDNINITFNGDLAGLARILKPQISREKNRVGTSFVTGGNKYE